MLFIGAWVADEIEDGVVQSTGATAALYSDSLIEPRVQELATAAALTEENERALDDLLSPLLAGKAIVGFKIWKGDTVVYSSESDLIGKSFPMSALRRRAWSGFVSAEFNKLDSPEDIHERDLHLPILEIYAPVRESGTQRIIALAETYEVAPTLQEKLSAARTESWIVVGASTLAIIALQFAIVHRGSRTIDEQRNALSDRIGQLSRLLSENEALRKRANQANQRVTEINERYLRQLGADLHDGPVQFLGMALLRLDSLSHTISGTEKAVVEDAEEDIHMIREALTDSLQEIRNVSGGLAPPEVEKLSLAGALEMVARRHERRTGTPVTFEIGNLPDRVPVPIKSCLYRFAQEGLNNAFRHANGEGQTMTATCDGRALEVSVVDSGPGMARTDTFDASGGQGLMGLRDRIESLGGHFTIRERPGGGTCLTARFFVVEEETVHG